GPGGAAEGRDERLERGRQAVDPQSRQGRPERARVEHDGRRALLLGVRAHHGAQRDVLPLPQLRALDGLLLARARRLSRPQRTRTAMSVTSSRGGAPAVQARSAFSIFQRTYSASSLPWRARRAERRSRPSSSPRAETASVTPSVNWRSRS